MENYKFIDISKLQEEAFGNIKNIIGLDSQNEVIKASKQDSYTKDEIDDLLRDAEISADKLQNKIQINSASTDYVITQPTVSGDSLVITDAMSDKNQYHTFGYDKSFTYEGGVYRTDFIFEEQNNRHYSCPDWDVDKNTLTMNVNSESYGQFQFQLFDSNFKKTAIDITISEGSITLSKTEPNNLFLSSYSPILSITIDGEGFSYFPGVLYGSVSKTFGNNSNIVFKLGKLGTVYGMSVPPSISTTGEQNILQSIETVTGNTSNYPERLNDYIRYANDVKAYILTDKNTKFKTINGEQITGNGDITIDTNVDLSDYATKTELATKQDTLVSGTNIKSINGTSLLGSGNMELATKEELNAKQDVISDLDSIRSGAALGATALQSVPSEYATEQWVNEQGFLKEHQDISNLATKSELATKQDVISDLDSIRSGAALGATALQSVPDTYALKSEIPDITTKQDKLVSGTNIKTINGTSLLGSGNIVIEASSDNVPTLQTDKEGTTNNYIYSSGQNDKYGVISDFYTDIVYTSDKASIHTDWYYWGNTDKYMVDGAAGWSIEGATTSQAGLMTSSDKTKLDGIDLSTKQDTLVSGTNIKTINGTSLLGSGDITIEGGSGNVDLSDYYTKSQTNALVSPKLSQVTLTQAEYDALQTKENNVLYVISDAEDIKFKTINGAQITGEGNIEVATKSELNEKQDVISDLVTIRSGAAKGATALQSVPSGYATEQWVNEQGFLKEHQDISNLATKAELNAKQDTLVSGTNIKTVNGTSLLGSGNIEIAKEWIGTQAQYDALPTKDNNTTYYITE